MPELIPFHNSPAFFSKQSAASSIYQISVLLSVDQCIVYGNFIYSFSNSFSNVLSIPSAPSGAVIRIAMSATESTI